MLMGGVMSGQEAFDILQANEIDRVFRDLMMPDMDGFAFLATKVLEIFSLKYAS